MTNTESTQQQGSVIRKAEGVTSAERYLTRLCERTFLSLWSYPGVYRDQGRPGQSGDGKEVCDLLVVFEDHIIIFSDKDCTFPNTGNLVLDWRRWFRRAVLKSAEQVWGAERWIKSYPERLFLDRRCQQPFPLALPDPAKAKFHRVVVAHDSAKRCRQELGGSGSLMIMSDIIGPMHYEGERDDIKPFAVGQIDPSRGFVHVLDDTSLGILLSTLNTVTDFVAYLTKKERLLGGTVKLFTAGEEDLLAYYLKHTDASGEHYFDVPSRFDAIALEEGFWHEFAQNPQRLAQIEADRISYAWDALIEKFNKHIMERTQYFTTRQDVAHKDEITRFLAREPRLRRRMLASSLLDIIRTTPKTHRRTQVYLPSRPGEPYYVFLLLARPDFITYEDYRVSRRTLLEYCCLVTKLRFPAALDIVGIATEPLAALDKFSSEDAMYLDAREWSPEMEAEAKRVQQEFSLLTNKYPDC